MQAWRECTPLPSNRRNIRIAKALPAPATGLDPVAGGLQGVKPPGGFQGEALISLASPDCPAASRFPLAPLPPAVHLPGDEWIAAFPIGACRGGPDGTLTYIVDVPPEALPPVLGRDLERAWYAARDAAIAQTWGAVRGFRFHRPDGSHTDLALADRDARCWAGAIDGTAGIGTSYGLSLCLRLLALIDLLARVDWAVPLLRLQRDGAELHPSLLRTAATAPLTQEARFDEARFRSRLPPFLLAPAVAPVLAGARA